VTESVVNPASGCKAAWLRVKFYYTHWLYAGSPRVGSAIDPLRFLAGCCKSD